ncbi:MAG: FKBP-type peptidyl-prolyl cis-trans isomerase [Aureispira sp.]|nr:FKBP-type peptidyl-prolyl cis-trans isomerase [Aureispira sp.]
MKKLFIPVLAVCLLATSFTTQAQNSDKLKAGKVEKTTATDKVEKDVDRFSYGYGVLLATSLKQQGLTLKDINTDDFIEGLKAVMEGQTPKVDVATAQNEVNAKIQAMMAKKGEVNLKAGQLYMEKNAKKKGVKQTASGIQYEIMKAGEGAKPTATSKVTTHYHGTLIDGTVFDSSVDRGQPATFPVNGVIKGWQEILPMMPIGSKWRVTIPAHLAYGNRGQGSIKANSTLIFEIELISIQ